MKAVRDETTRRFGPQPEGRRTGGKSVHWLLRGEAKALSDAVRCDHKQLLNSGEEAHRSSHTSRHSEAPRACAP